MREGHYFGHLHACFGDRFNSVLVKNMNLQILPVLLIASYEV